MMIKLFKWLHSSFFYKSYHLEIFKHIKYEHNKTWLDVGCGPGILSQMAANHNYQTTGIDFDPRMIMAANGLNSNLPITKLKFLVGSVYELPPEKFDIVSASSLLPVLTDKELAIKSLLNATRDNGILIFVESNDNFTFKNALKIYLKNKVFSDLGFLLMGIVRRGRNKSNLTIQHYFNANEIIVIKLFHEMIDLTIIKKSVFSNT